MHNVAFVSFSTLTFSTKEGSALSSHCWASITMRDDSACMCKPRLRSTFGRRDCRESTRVSKSVFLLFTIAGEGRDGVRSGTTKKRQTRSHAHFQFLFFPRSSLHQKFRRFVCRLFPLKLSNRRYSSRRMQQCLCVVFNRGLQKHCRP